MWRSISFSVPYARVAYKFQVNLLKIMLQLEDAYYDLAISSNQPTVMLCDRGALGMYNICNLLLQIDHEKSTKKCLYWAEDTYLHQTVIICDISFCSSISFPYSHRLLCLCWHQHLAGHSGRERLDACVTAWLTLRYGDRDGERSKR